MKIRHVVSTGIFVVSLFGVAVAQNFGPSLSAGPEAAKREMSALMISAQAENQILASDLVGTRVYGRSGQEVGVVRDILLNVEGRMDGLLVSVGGLLGIGARTIGVPLKLIDVARSPDGRMAGVRVGLSRADAEEAPSFRETSGGPGSAAARTAPIPASSPP